MKLQKYLKEMCVNRNEFSKKVGVTYPTISNIMTGRTDMHLALALRIEDLTEGKVTCRDLVNPLFMKNLELKSALLIKRANEKKKRPHDGDAT